jgi:hypothetical protein
MYKVFFLRERKKYFPGVYHLANFSPFKELEIFENMGVHREGQEGDLAPLAG